MSGEAIYEGKAKVLLTTDDPERLVQYFKDDATAFNGVKKGTIGGKGEVNCAMSSILFQLLREAGIDSHFLERSGPREMLVRRLTIIPVEVVIRNIVAGSLSKRLGLDEGTAIPKGPIVELYYKRDDLNDPMITESHIEAFDMADLGDIAAIKASGVRVNEVLVPFFKARGMDLVDFKLEYGHASDGSLLLGDEITPDGCRLWEVGTGRKMDKDRFRRDLGDIEETYQEVLARVQGAPE